MFLVNVHKLDVVLADPVLARCFESNVDDVWCILRLEREDIIWPGRAKDLRQGAQVDTERDVAVTAEPLESARLEQHRDQGNVGVVHGLESNARVIAVEVAVLHQILNGVHDLLEDVGLS